MFALRGCPTGWLGAYGNEWVATPNLDRLAAEAVVFDRHVSDRPDPATACAAWLGGTGTPVTTALRAGGVRAVLVRANHPENDGPDWFYAGWDEVFDARPADADKSPLDALLRSLPDLLDRLGPDFLLFVDIDRLLPPWDVRQDVFEAYVEDDPEEDDNEEAEADESDEDEDEEAETEPLVPEEPVTPWADPPTGPFDATDADAREFLHASFAAVVTSLDAELGKVFDQLRSRRLDRSAAWLLTSDFGLPLGEHGQIGRHRPWLHEELVHLPLILRLPDADQACRRVAGFTQPPDVAATLLDLFGLPAGEGSLVPVARGLADPARTRAVTRLELNGAAEAAVRTDGWACLLPLRVPDGEVREPMLFEKPDDRWEVNDLRGRNLDTAEELEAGLRDAQQG